MDAAFLRRIVEIQIEQGDLLKRFARMTAIHEMDNHVYIHHGGNKLQQAGREMGHIEECIKQNQEKLRELVADLHRAPATAS